MYNVKAAVSRLTFAPRPKDMKVTDVKTGRFVFVPKTGKLVSREDLARAITRAGYEAEQTWIEVRGTLRPGDRLDAAGTGQGFALAGTKLPELRKAAAPDSSITLRGKWLAGPGAGTIEVESWQVER